MPTSASSIASWPARTMASTGPGTGSTSCATPNRTATSQIPAATADEQAEYQRQLAVWEEATADIRLQIAGIEDPIRGSAMHTTRVKFTDDLLEMLAKPPGDRTPIEAQLAYLVEYQVSDGEG